MVGHRFGGPIFSTTRAFHVLFIWDAQEMYVLALVTQKGGSGKSTLAVGLAVAAMENGERVAFVEADPQGTISKWKQRRGHPPAPPAPEPRPPPHLRRLSRPRSSGRPAARCPSLRPVTAPTP